MSDESDRIRQLEERLAAAEQVCVIFGWTAGGMRTEQDKALHQAWSDWAAAYGTVSPTPEWRARVAELAARRDEIRERTLAGIRRGAGPEPRSGDTSDLGGSK